MRPVSLTMTLAQKPKKIPVGPSQPTSQPDRNEQRTNHDPKLPEHNQGTSNPRRGHLSRVNGDRGILGSNSDTQDKACSEQVLP